MNKEHVNTYELEKSKDTLLLTIRMICLMYLENTKLIENIETSKIKDYLEYTKNEYYKINDLKNSLKVKTYSQPYFEIYTNLDSMILKDNLICSQEKVSFLELTKDINHLEETLGFCYGVLNMIYQTRNEN